ncbi:MAG: hypothetical protein HOW73_47800 [Polyangiaceae bacterium]|nr:hypothetical protein [Polyangiaceae bacterium]
MKPLLVLVFMTGVGIGLTMAPTVFDWGPQPVLAWLGGLNLGAVVGVGLLVSRAA